MRARFSRGVPYFVQNQHFFALKKQNTAASSTASSTRQPTENQPKQRDAGWREEAEEKRDNHESTRETADHTRPYARNTNGLSYPIIHMPSDSADPQHAVIYLPGFAGCVRPPSIDTPSLCRVVTHSKIAARVRCRLPGKKKSPGRKIRA